MIRLAKPTLALIIVVGVVVAFAASASKAEAQAPPRALERGDRLYKKQDYFSASIELDKVARGQTNGTQKHVEHAQFFLGKTFYQLGMYAVALSHFQRVVQAGKTHSFFSATLKWYVALGQVVPISHVGGALRILEDGLNDPINEDVADEARYLLLRLDIADEDLTTAIARLRTIAVGSPHAALAI